MESKPLNVWSDDMSDYLKDKNKLQFEFTLKDGLTLTDDGELWGTILGMEKPMKQELKDYILDRLIALRIIESPCIDEYTCARVDELLLLLVELVDDAGE